MARILLITHVSPPAVDGGSRVIFKIGEHLGKNGHHLLTLSSDAKSTDDFTHPYQPIHPDGLQITNYLPAGRHDALRLPVYTIFHRPLKLFSRVWSKGPVFKLLPFIKFLITCFKFRPEIIIAGPLPTTTILYARFIRLITGAKLIINASFHYSDTEFHQPVLINSLQSADLIWTLTRHETNYFHNHFKIPFSKMIELGNGVDRSLIKTELPITNYRLPIKNPKLLFIGSFAKHKGLDVLFESLKFLPNNYQLTIAGQPTLSQINIPKKVTSILNFPNSDLGKIIDNCDILISPSTQESFGLVLLEAMARGKIVIASDIPASVELITNAQSGYIFQLNNPADLAKKIIYATKSSSTPKKQLLGWQYASSHTWDKIGESLWQKILSLD